MRSDKFLGVVVEVVSGDCLVVKDKASGVERRINLSSIRAPRMGTRDRAPDPWAAEAKEFLRRVVHAWHTTPRLVLPAHAHAHEGSSPPSAR